MENIAIIKEADFMASVRVSLAWALYHEARYDDARLILQEAIDTLAVEDIDERLACVILLAKIERAAGNLYEALRLHVEHRAHMDASSFYRLKAKFLHGLAVTYQLIASREGASGYTDKALLEYTASIVYLEAAGDMEQAGCTENNIALLLSDLGRVAEAHEYLARAERRFPHKPVKLAEIADTRAQLYLKENKLADALQHALHANSVFLAQNEKRLLLDSLRTLQKAAADFAASEQ